MDDQLLELEAELKTFRPRQPSAQLAQRLESELASEVITLAAPAPRAESKKVIRGAWFGASLAAAAAIAVVATVGVLRQQNQPALITSVPMAAVKTPVPTQVAVNTPASASNQYRPVRASNVLYDLKDEGVVYLEDRTPARQMRYRYLDTYTWKNPKNNASLKWSMPRDEVRVMPASLSMN